MQYIRKSEGVRYVAGRLLPAVLRLPLDVLAQEVFDDLAYVPTLEYGLGRGLALEDCRDADVELGPLLFHPTLALGHARQLLRRGLAAGPRPLPGGASPPSPAFVRILCWTLAAVPLAALRPSAHRGLFPLLGWRLRGQVAEPLLAAPRLAHPRTSIVSSRTSAQAR